MSEYLSKKAVLEFIKARKAKFAGSYKDIEYGAYLELETFEAHLGAFDADESEGTWKSAAEVLGRENAQMNSEIQRLRAALVEIKQILNEDRENDGAFQSWNHMQAWKVATQALSTTTEPTGPYTIRRDEYGHAVAIERNGYTVLHLQPGTERNEQEVEGIVALLNMNAAKVERVREYYRKLEELRNRTKYRDAAIEYEQRITDICNVLDFLGITIAGINATEKEENNA